MYRVYQQQFAMSKYIKLGVLNLLNGTSIYRIKKRLPDVISLFAKMGKSITTIFYATGVTR